MCPCVKVLAASLTAVVLAGLGVMITLHHGDCPSKRSCHTVCPLPSADDVAPLDLGCTAPQTEASASDDALAAGMGTATVATHAKAPCLIHCCDE